MRKRSEQIKLFNICVFSLAMFAGGIQSAQAALIVSYSTTAPTENALVSHPLTGATGALVWDGDSTPRDVAQSFLAPSTTKMSSFSLMLGGSSSVYGSEDSCTLTVYESMSSSSLGSVISTQSGNYAKYNSSIGVGNWVTFDMDDVDLIAGRYYAVALSWDNEEAQKNQNFRTFTENKYTDGGLWYDIGAGFTAAGSSSADFGFVVQQIPEPKTLGLMLVAGGLLTTVMRRWRFFVK